MNWMNLPEQYHTSKSRFVILPIAYEKDVSYGKGASQGPKAIIKASQYMEYYDEQYDCEAFEDGIIIETIEDMKDKTPEDMISVVIEKIKKIKENNKNKFIISIGGDHAVTNGIIQGMDAVEKEPFGVIQFDAHSDFRESWNNSKYNHACVAKRIAEKHPLVLLGIRSQDIDEVKTIQDKKNVFVVKAYEYDIKKIRSIISALPKKVYITIDVDVFDPSFIRNTGTPEPGGLGWYDVLKALEIIFMEKKVIGADIVEFAPKENYEAEAYSLARLTYKIMSLVKKFSKV